MSLSDLVVCPRCRHSVLERDDGFECSECRTKYPRIGGIPVLVREPDALVHAWSRLLYRFDLDMRAGLDELLAQTTTFDLMPRTRTRLETLHEHLGRHRLRLVELLEGAGIARIVRESSPSVAAGARLLHPSLLEYYVQIHRDWGWDESTPNEARAAADAVSAILGDRPLGKLLVLGAGACRLTEELHHRHAADSTLALDIDPLPFIVANKLLRGEKVPLYEFPPWPIDAASLFADRTLSSRRENQGTRIHLAFADAVDPPVPPESFDSVVTPWFLDQVPEAMPHFLETIRSVLRVGGRFINSGPLLFQHERTPLPQRYLVDEVLELVESVGFRIEQHDFRRLSYLASPIGCQGRIETVLTFSAEKLAEAPARARETKAPWLSDDGTPVPRFAGLDGYRPEHPMFEAIVGLVDGARTAADIARELVKRHGLPPDAALPAVRAALHAIARKLGV